MEGLTGDETLIVVVACAQMIACGALLIMQIQSSQDDSLLGLDDDARSDVLEGTGRWMRKPKAWEERFWEKEARYLDAKTFFQTFRCRKLTFYHLVVALYGTTEHVAPSRGRGPSYDPCERVAIFLHRVGLCSAVRSTSLRFGVSEGTVTQVTMAVAHRIIIRLLDEYVAWPTVEEQREIARAWELEKYLRYVIGAIDGSHIRIRSPGALKAVAYYNYKHFFSIVLLAIVDNIGMFRWFASGAPGSCGDSGVFQSCHFYRDIVGERSRPAGEREIFADGACLLGDSAFAETPWMRTPVADPKTREERYFNYKHSSMRFRVEHAFGRLKWKFTALQSGLLFSLEHAPVIIDACVILYNFFLVHEGDHSASVFCDTDQTRAGTGRRASTTDGCNSGAGVDGGSGSAPPSARSTEIQYLADEGFLLQDWGLPGSRADLMRSRDEARRKRARRSSGLVDAADPMGFLDD